MFPIKSQTCHIQQKYSVNLAVHKLSMMNGNKIIPLLLANKMCLNESYASPNR